MDRSVKVAAKTKNVHLDRPKTAFSRVSEPSQETTVTDSPALLLARSNGVALLEQRFKTDTKDERQVQIAEGNLTTVPFAPI